MPLELEFPTIVHLQREKSVIAVLVTKGIAENVGGKQQHNAQNVLKILLLKIMDGAVTPKLEGCAG